MSGSGTSESDSKLGGWVSSMKLLLGFLRDEALGVKACSISGVPEQFRKSEKESEPYKPKVVSIGPLYKGNKRDLLHMEEIKYRFMHSLFHRTTDPLGSFDECSKIILHLDMLVRTFYVDDIEFNNYDLAKIMLLDGCFLLELLITKAEESDNDFRALQSLSGVPLQIKSHEFKHSLADVRKMSEVLLDLKLLGNQIPLFVLILLFHILFVPAEIDSDGLKHVRKIINALALFLFGCTHSVNVTDCPNAAHLLDTVHSFETKNEDGNRIAPESKHHLKLKCCAYRFLSDGIKITRAEDHSFDFENEGAIFGCYKLLKKGTLEIQRLNITEEKEIEWRNFVAWEQNRITHEKYVGGKHDRTSCRFSEIAVSLRGLVCCEHDIKLLYKSDVLETQWSNEDLMNFFRSLARGIQIDTNMVDKYDEMIQTLKENPDHRINFKLFWLWHKLKRVMINAKYELREMFATLKRDHTPTVWKTIGVIAAVVLLFLTVAQTVFAAIGL
ncbi:UPF0481 protein At3g47200 [Cajanus cajan]|uniref:UPF0481 protein At3g47200 family n=1 Tax=Cajanus cajan TaxID=3821 RepID=A0A151SG63_CAJCA|nr:UPF0481 protein At3g47200 [Cajanus cajan]XP_020229107.1 UPF0481 protein At3g47200 [Cajanus cajan]XP_029129539.1 UPF0481 protein At3g47200 [Cajanus cajan]XP_029129540.1 UPF0481 protein At3g47200 [Cajanus cajan]KYP53834.1 UPF0481 protein At3g47200 family [Cajanus cajan]